jgi:GNAT superfamily N-acetyltransferase
MSPVKELKNETEWLAAFPVMQELRTHLTKEEYVKLLKQMVPEGYRMFALYEQEQIVAVTGIIELTNLYHGKHIYVYDLVSKQTERSKGYGEKLLSSIHDLAKQLGCSNVALSSGLQRVDAHRFYQEKMDYKKTSFAFVHSVE